MVAFVNLIEDVLLHIFSFLDPVDLYAISCLEEETLDSALALALNRASRTMLVTGSECFPGMNRIEHNEDRLRIHHNWVKGQFQASTLFVEDDLTHIGRMRMDSDHFYVSNKGELRKYGRLENGLAGLGFDSYGDIEDPVISTVHLDGDHLFTGTYYGTCSYIKNGVKVLDNFKLHESYKDILAIDFHQSRQVLATSNFREIKLFNVDGQAINPLGEMDWRGRCLKFNDSCDQLIVGNVVTDFHTAEGFISKLTPLSVYDTTTLQRTDLKCTSAGVVDMVWHSSPQVMLTGHWTGDLRMLDLRSGDEIVIRKSGKEDVNVSLQYDGRHGVVCGFLNTNEVALYDLRQTKERVKSFGELKSSELGTSLLGVLVDARNLFVVNFREVRVFNFTG